MLSVIFDMDGLMIDSERVFVDNYVRAGLELGYGDIRDICLSTIGVTSQRTKDIFCERYGMAFDYDGLRARGRRYISEYYAKNGVPVKDGLFPLLEYLQSRDAKTAVATSTSRESAAETLYEKTNIGEYFDAVIYGDDVTKSKPEPDIYLAAAGRINAEPKDCYVLEDSINGIKAAHAAGMKPIMVPDLIQPTDEIKTMVHAVCGDLYGVLELMRCTAEL